MDPRTQQTIRDCLQVSIEGRMHFGQVVATLIEAGVESYHVDYRAGRSTYYLPCGDTFTIETSVPEFVVAECFDAAGIRAAIRGAQDGKVMYPEFKRLSQAAGCVAYTVWISGKHVTYFGRNGETHREQFPR